MPRRTARQCSTATRQPTIPTSSIDHSMCILWHSHLRITLLPGERQRALPTAPTAHPPVQDVRLQCVWGGRRVRVPHVGLPALQARPHRARLLAGGWSALRGRERLQHTFGSDASARCIAAALHL